MGRPCKFQPDRKITLSVAMDISQYDLIYKASRSRGVSMAEFMRDAAISEYSKVLCPCGYKEPCKVICNL